MDKYCRNKIKSRDEFFCIDLRKGTGTLVDVFLSLNRIECLPQKICFRLKSTTLKPHFNQIITRDCIADTDLLLICQRRLDLLGIKLL